MSLLSTTLDNWEQSFSQTTTNDVNKATLKGIFGVPFLYPRQHDTDITFPMPFVTRTENSTDTVSKVIQDESLIDFFQQSLDIEDDDTLVDSRIVTKPKRVYHVKTKVIFAGKGHFTIPSDAECGLQD